MEVPEWIKAIAPLVSGVVGILVGIWHAGKRSGKEEADQDARLNERIDTRVKEATAPFDETLRGLRQKINDVELYSAKTYLEKDEFKDFREEYRDDVKRIFERLDSIPRGRQ